MTAATIPVGRSIDGIDPTWATEVLPPGADKRLWRVMRRKGFGGSDASALLGLSGHRATVELWEDKTGRVPILDVPPSEAAEMGELLEPVVRDRFARIHDVDVRLAGMLWSSRWPWMYANVDGLVDDGGALAGYEGKTCSTEAADQWGTDRLPLVPDHAELQSQWGMAVTGLSGWWVACLIGGQRNVYRYVHRDDELIADLVAVREHWWTTYVVGDREPPADGGRAWTSYLRKKFAVAEPDSVVEISPAEAEEVRRRRRDALAAERDAKKDHEALKNTVRRQLGAHERLVVGDVTVATWEHTRRFRHVAFADEQPELAARYVTHSPTTDVAALQREHPEIHRRYCVRQLRFID